MRRIRTWRSILLITAALVAGCTVKPPPNTGVERSGVGQLPLHPAGEVLSVKAVGADSAWVVSDKGIYRTTDRGEHWQDVTPTALNMPEQPAAVAQNAHFLDTQSAWLWAPEQDGPGTFFHTTDAGKTWATAASPVNPFMLANVSFADVDHGWMLVQIGHAAGHEYVDVYRTMDGGLTWTSVTRLRTEQDKNGLPSFGGKGTIGAERVDAAWIGYHLESSDTLSAYHTQDGGQSWQKTSLPTIPGHAAGKTVLLNPQFFPDQVWVWPAYSYDAPSATLTFYVSRNQGQTWTPTVPVSAGIFAFAVYRYSLPDSQHWWASFSTGNPQEAGETKLYRTTNGGQGWQELTPQPPLTGLFDLSFGSPQEGWAIVRTANTNTLLHSADGGETWK